MILDLIINPPIENTDLTLMMSVSKQGEKRQHSLAEVVKIGGWTKMIHQMKPRIIIREEVLTKLKKANLKYQIYQQVEWKNHMMALTFS